jgi:drug/metabolite transporter (DMT)-like permease
VDPEIGAVTAALIGALAYGTGDFMGGRAALRVNTFMAVAVAQTVAVAYMLHVFAQSAQTSIDDGAFQQSIVAGLAYSGGLLLLYHGLAHGRIAVVAPLCGLFSILVPLAGDLHYDREIGEWGMIGIAFCALAVILIAGSGIPDPAGRPLGYSVRLGIASGLGYGAADLLLGSLPADQASGALLTARIVAAAVAVALLAGSLFAVRTVTRSGPLVASTGLVVRPSPNHLRFVVAGLALAATAGVFDMVGQIGYVVAATQGSMGVAAGLVALFPAVSVVLAVVILREPVSVRQLYGFAASMVGVSLVSI